MSALPHAARLAAAALRGLSRASLPVLLVALLRATDPPITPRVLAEGVLALALLPELCARLVLRAFRADVLIGGETLRIAGAWRRIEAPIDSIDRAATWRVPLPSPGISLALRSGARFPVGLAAPELRGLVSALAARGIAVPGATDPGIAHAEARAGCPRRWWDRPLVKIGLAALLPTAIAFNAHQHIAFGGFLGEYYLMGLGAWLATGAQYLGATLIYLVVWAGCFRISVEAAAWLAAIAAPARAAAARRIAERAAALAYYASVPALLALRFLA